MRCAYGSSLTSIAREISRRGQTGSCEVMKLSLEVGKKKVSAFPGDSSVDDFT